MAALPDRNNDAGLFRWQALFQRATEPLFLLNGNRRVLFVNQAFEKLAGLKLAEARGLVCKQRRDVEPGSPEALAEALTPPPEVLAGQPARRRRSVTGPGPTRKLWDVDFLPIRGPSGLLGVLGKIAPVTAEVPPVSRLAEDLVGLREEWARRWQVDPGSLPALRRVADQVKLASQTQVSVWLQGAAGAGKEHLARSIHFESGACERAFASIDCAGLPLPALAPTLLGVAGLLRRASQGTVHLHEPAALPRDLQVRLCDWLAEPGASRPRIISSSVHDPAGDVRAGRLLEELYVALATLVIHLPPLRERKDDLPALVDQLLRRLAPGGTPPPPLTPEALEIFQAYSWPRNLQELAEVLAGAASRAGDGRIEAAHLPAYLRQAVHLAAVPGRPGDRLLPLDQLLEQVERRLITLALRMAAGNKTKAAEILAIWRPRLLRRMEALGIADPAPAESEDVQK